MRQEQAITNYLVKTYLIALFAVLGVGSAITAVLVLWQPLAWLAANFF